MGFYILLAATAFRKFIIQQNLLLTLLFNILLYWFLYFQPIICLVLNWRYFSGRRTLLYSLLDLMFLIRGLLFIFRQICWLLIIFLQFFLVFFCYLRFNDLIFWHLAC